MSLKQKAVKGLSWSFIDNLSRHGANFIFSIILARLLTPADFGIIGITGVLLALSEVFIQGGLGVALIRKKNATQEDYSTVFHFNLLISVVLYTTLCFAAPAISQFFDESQLVSVIRVISLVLIIQAFLIVQISILTKRLDFKLQTKITIASTLVAGIVGVTMAYSGLGVWSLVGKSIANGIVAVFLFWILNKWRPSFAFSLASFRELFSFGSKLLVSNIISMIYQNIFTLLIAKYFSNVELGYFTKAKHLSQLPTKNLDGIISRVSFPVLATLQDDPVKLKMAYKKLITSSMLVTFILMMGMAAVAEPLIITLIGEKWRSSVVYLQLLSLIAMFFPLQSLNLNILKVLGRSGLFLKLEIVKKALIVPVLIIGVKYGIIIMLILMFIHTIIAYFINSYWSGKAINYTTFEQLKDIMPAFIAAFFVASVVYFVGMTLFYSYFLILLLQLFSGILLFVAVCELFNLTAYKYLKGILIEKLRSV